MAAQASPLPALQDHGESHPTLRADGDQSELHIAALHLIRQRRHEATARRAEWMANRNRSAHDVDDVFVDLPALGGEALKIREYLRRKGFVNLDDPQVLPLNARA